MTKNKIREYYLKKYGTVTMSFEQYRMYKSGELSLCEIKDMKRAEQEINKLLAYPQVFKKATVIVALLMSLESKCYAMAVETGFDQQMDRLGKIVDKTMQIVYVIQTVGFIICLIMGLIEIIKALVNKDTGAIISVGIKYLLGFSALFIFPYLLKMIFDILGYNGGILW